MQETNEVLEAIGELGAIVAKHLKDGYQHSDVAAIAADLMLRADVQATLKRAGDGIQKVPTELKAVRIRDGLLLSKTFIANGEKILAALE